VVIIFVIGVLMQYMSTNVSHAVMSTKRYKSSVPSPDYLPAVASRTDEKISAADSIKSTGWYETDFKSAPRRM